MGKYIGNARVLEIFTSNVRDDIEPDGVSVTFPLSQEVPGGHEENVMVMRRKFTTCELLTGSSVVEFNAIGDTITCSNANASLLLSTVKPGDTLIIAGAVNALNNGEHTVLSVSYSDPNITIELDASLADETGGSVDVTQGVIEQWELLEPVVDYIIEGVGAEYHKLITFSEVLSTKDYAYVIHRGEATYNFVPSAASVGPDQLHPNLRNFATQKLDPVAETNFPLTQVAANASELIVTLDGVVQEGRDSGSLDASDWELNATGDEIDFLVAITGRLVIKHMGFSTISRRASLNSVDTANITNGSVTSSKLAADAVTTTKIQNGAVTTDKLADDSVDGSKILLNNDEFLNALDSLAAEQGLLKLNSTNETELNSPNDLISAIANVVITRLSATELIPETTDSVSLGNATNKFKDATLSGDIENDGDVITHGNIVLDASNTVDGVDVSDLESRVSILEGGSVMPGMLMMWAQDAAPPSGWLLANGQVVAQATYPDLFASIGTSFNQGGEAGTDFRVPDFRQRFPLGKADSGTGSNWGNAGRGGAIDHVHQGGLHTHGFAHTHTSPGHYHSKGTLNIVSSGSHTTSISHNHGSTNTAYNTTGHSVTDPGHDHSGSTQGGYANITISGAGAHTHRVLLKTNSSIPTGGAKYRFPLNSSGSVYQQQNNDNTDLVEAVGNHTHPYTQAPHFHDISSDTTGITIGSGNHRHSVDLPNFSGSSSSDGEHIHSSGSFAGSVGNAGGVDGDSDITTNSQDTSTSDSGGSVDTTANNPPYQVIHFIIKT